MMARGLSVDWAPFVVSVCEDRTVTFVPTEITLAPSVLRNALQSLDGRSFGSYRSIQGCYAFGSFRLLIDRVQRDPYAPPTLIRIFVPLNVSGYDPNLYSNRHRRNGFCDFLTRAIARVLRDSEPAAAGSGNSGRIEIAVPGQEIVERTSVQLTAGCIETRIYAGLPAAGRRIQGDKACAMLLDQIPSIAKSTLFASTADLVRHPSGG